LNQKNHKRIAVIGPRGITAINLEKYLPPDTTEIVSGGAKGVDTAARGYAIKNNLKLTEFLSEYDKYGKSAPLKRNMTIIEYADIVLAFWDGISRGTKFFIDNFKNMDVPVKIFVKSNNAQKGVK
jgi:hypothetical protein